MKRLEFDYGAVSGVLLIHALPADHARIEELIAAKSYFHGTLPVHRHGEMMVFLFSPLVTMADMETLRNEIQELLGLTDDQVVGKG